MFNTFTKVVLALIAASSVLFVNTQKVISVPNGAADRNTVWGEWEICPPGSHAHQFTTQNDFLNIGPAQDASALNSIVLFCDDITGTNISSTLG